MFLEERILCLFYDFMRFIKIILFNINIFFIFTFTTQLFLIILNNFTYIYIIAIRISLNFCNFRTSKIITKFSYHQLHGIKPLLNIIYFIFLFNLVRIFNFSTLIFLYFISHNILLIILLNR